MKSFWNSLKIFKTKTEKILHQVIHKSVLDIDTEKQLNPLLETFQSVSAPDSWKTNLEFFFSLLKESDTADDSLKLLYIAHAAIILMGEKFCTPFLSLNLIHLHQLKPAKQAVDDYVLRVLVSNYYNFLICLANYLQDIRDMKKVSPSEILRSLLEGEFKYIVQLITFKNILKYSFKVEESLETSISLLDKSDQPLLHKIAHRILNDSADLYSLISRILKKCMGEIFNMKKDIVFLVDELYSDTIFITKKIRVFLKKCSVEESNIPLFEIFHIDPDFNKKEELFVLGLKKNYIQKSPRPYLEYMNEYQTIQKTDYHNVNDTPAALKSRLTEEEESFILPSHDEIPESQPLNRSAHKKDLLEMLVRTSDSPDDKHLVNLDMKTPQSLADGSPEQMDHFSSLSQRQMSTLINYRENNYITDSKLLSMSDFSPMIKNNKQRMQ